MTKELEKETFQTLHFADSSTSIAEVDETTTATNYKLSLVTVVIINTLFGGSLILQRSLGFLAFFGCLRPDLRLQCCSFTCTRAG
jgi:hypothetical protein